MIIACALSACYAVGLRRCPDVPSLALFTVLAAAAFLSALPLAGIEFVLGSLQAPTPKGWMIIALIVIFPSFLGQVFFILGVREIGPGRAGIFVNLVPVFASIIAVTVLSEPFEVYHGLALALVLGGIWLAERSKRRQVQPKDINEPD